MRWYSVVVPRLILSEIHTTGGTHSRPFVVKISIIASIFLFVYKTELDMRWGGAWESIIYKHTHTHTHTEF